MPQGLSVRVRLVLIGPGAGMRVARASLPRFGALRRDNTPTPACLCICSISGTELLLELFLRSVPSASDLVYACVWGMLVAGHAHGRSMWVLMRECESESILLDGWMDGYI